MKLKKVKKPILSFLVIIIIITMVIPVLAIDTDINEDDILLEDSNIITEDNILDINETIISETEYNDLEEEINVTDLENEAIVETEINVTAHEAKNNLMIPVPLANIALVGNTSDDLQAAVNNATSGDTIIISNNITYTTTTPSVTIPSGKEIAIQSNTGNAWTLSKTKDSTRHFIINGTLSLQNIVLEGGSSSGGVIVNSGAYFNMNDNTTIQNCYNYYGGAVINFGVFYMYGGTITKCSSANGGGVRCDADGSFTLYDGTINNNSSEVGGGLSIAKARYG